MEGIVFCFVHRGVTDTLYLATDGRSLSTTPAMRLLSYGSGGQLDPDIPGMATQREFYRRLKQLEGSPSYFLEKPEFKSYCAKSKQGIQVPSDSTQAALTQAVTPPVVQLCKPRVSTWVVRRGTGAEDEASSVVRNLPGVPERAGPSAELGRAWSRTGTTSSEAGRGGGHPQVGRIGGGFRRRASCVYAALACGRTCVGAGGGFPARWAPRGGGGSG